MPISPQTLPENGFPRIFPNFGKIGEGPPGPLCISYWPFEGLAILSTDLVDPSLLYNPLGSWYAWVYNNGVLLCAEIDHLGG